MFLNVYITRHLNGDNPVTHLGLCHGPCSLIAGKWDSRRSQLSGPTFLPMSRFSSM